jgi:hypothetical protein
MIESWRNHLLTREEVGCTVRPIVDNDSIFESNGCQPCLESRLDLGQSVDITGVNR